MPNSTKSQVFKIPLYLLNGWHYLVKLKAWREFWETAGLKDRRCRPFLLKIRVKKKLSKVQKQCSFEKKKKIIRNPFKKIIFLLVKNESPCIQSENYYIKTSRKFSKTPEKILSVTEDYSSSMNFIAKVYARNRFRVPKMFSIDRKTRKTNHPRELYFFSEIPVNASRKAGGKRGGIESRFRNDGFAPRTASKRA